MEMGGDLPINNCNKGTPMTDSYSSSEGPVWRQAIEKVFSILRKVEPYGQSAVLLALRLIYGVFFAQTGWGKLHNIERTTAFFESLQLPLPGLMVYVVGSIEFLGGVLLAIGAGTRFIALTLTVVMMVAFLSAHADDAFASVTSFTEQAPYPFLVATLVLMAFGAGWVSIDGIVKARLNKKS